MHNVFTVKNSRDWQLPQKSNLINFSLLKELNCAAPFRSFSVKYVCHGSEIYTVNGNKYNIKTGQYLLANHFAEGLVEIDKPVKGICIDVSPDLLSEVVASYRRPDTAFADSSLDSFFNSPDFIVNKYRSDHTNVGQFLRQLDLVSSENPSSGLIFSREFYFTLAEKILADHVPIFKQLQAIRTLKSVTKNELLRRIFKAKEFIDFYFKTALDVKTIALECCMSEYHFFRLFKIVLGVSPHQYIIQKRIAHAAERIKQGKTNITDLALESGFSDIYAFSKSFKKYFGISPSFFLKKYSQLEPRLHSNK